MEQKFYGNGKLLLSGEYVLLDGAKGLALPTRYGQALSVNENRSGLLRWKSLDPNGLPWFEGEYDLNGLLERSNTNTKTAEILTRILRQAQALNPDFLTRANGYEVKTRLSFPKNWGLGTSSTLIYTLACWADIDPYQLLHATFGGSGYDIACAGTDTPILYQIENNVPKVESIAWDVPFKDRLFFVYLNQKRNSREAIAMYRKRDMDHGLIADISSITEQLTVVERLSEFERLLSAHENLISKALDIATVQHLLFDDYPHAVKSLGAWGGDFVLATGDAATSPTYFKEKGYDTVIPFSKMILS